MAAETLGRVGNGSGPTRAGPERYAYRASGGVTLVATLVARLARLCGFQWSSQRILTHFPGHLP